MFGISLLAAIPIAGLRLDTEVMGLLPPNLPAAQAYAEIQEVFGGGASLAIMLGDHDHLSPAQRDGASALLSQVAEELSVLRWRGRPALVDISADPDWEDQQGLAALLALTPLFMPPEKLDSLIARLRPSRVEARLRAGPPPGSPQRWREEDPLGLWSASYLPFWQERLPTLRRDGATLLSPDGQWYVLALSAVEPPQHAAFSQFLVAAVEGVLERHAAAAAEQGLSWDWLSGHRVALQDFATARRSAWLMSLGSVIGVLGLFALLLRNLRLLLLAGLLLVPALAAAVGLGGSVIAGPVSLLVLAFAAILAGMGVDVIIHAYWRWQGCYGELAQRQWLGTLRRRRAARRRAVILALPALVPALMLAALTTVAAFLVLASADFRGLQQLGLVSAAGLVVLVALVLLALPAALSCLAPLHPQSAWLDRWWQRLAPSPRLLGLALAGALLGLGGWWWSSSEPFPITSDLRDLRPSADTLGQQQRRLLERLGRSGRQEVLLVAAADGRRVLDALQVAEAIVAEQLPTALLQGSALTRIWPAPAQRRASAQRLAAEVDWAGLGQLAANHPQQKVFFDQLRQLAERLEEADPLRHEDLLAGPWARLMTQHLRPRPQGGWLGRALWRLNPDCSTAQLIAVIEPMAAKPAFADAELALAGESSLGHYLNHALAAEVQRLLLWALLGSALVLLLALRQPALVLVLLAILATSLLLLAAVVSLTPLRWHLLTIAVLPLVVGIGIDDVVHLIHHLRVPQAPAGWAARCRFALRRAGPPMLITSLTTGVGFASLLLADYRGLQDMGLVAVLGIGSCWIMSVGAAPLLACLVEREGAGRRAPPPGV
ncbi:MAG: hypothetical protein EA402_01500 [Planctomycetota bacterium]|nr:MAG: hypothetical protein EA402_01500 [Planctomycetota bacterium]